MRIFNLSNKSGSLTSSDKFVLDNGTNVMKIDYNALAKAIIEQYTGSTLAGSAQSVKAALDALAAMSPEASAAGHNSIFRGKSLGNTITDAQNTAIRNRTYAGLFIGDYWTIDGVKYRIAAIDYYYNIGDTNFNKGNIIVVPDTQLYAHQMCYTESGGYEAGSVNTTEGAYANSYGRTTGLAQARTKAAAAFGSHVASHRIMLANATSNGKPSGWAWTDSDGIELMNEQQVYGARAWGACEQNGYDIGTQKMQFPLFLYAPQYVNTRQSYWLQDVRSSAFFAHVYSYGGANYNYASNAFGIRPAITLSYI